MAVGHGRGQGGTPLRSSDIRDRDGDRVISSVDTDYSLDETMAGRLYLSVEVK